MKCCHVHWDNELSCRVHQRPYPGILLWHRAAHSQTSRYRDAPIPRIIWAIFKVITLVMLRVSIWRVTESQRVVVGSGDKIIELYLLATWFWELHIWTADRKLSAIASKASITIAYTSNSPTVIVDSVDNYPSLENKRKFEHQSSTQISPSPKRHPGKIGTPSQKLIPNISRPRETFKRK